ncbi:MAG TPA: hypothetical protein DCP90_03230 [Clostridiales bacterium]|nr:hypothetical protein [Clostridiales bacterium]
MKYTLYHGSIESFSTFEESKINAHETDANYNGFWFTSDKWASPAWRNPKYIKKCIVTLNNPAPHDIIKKVYKEVRNSPDYETFRSIPDAVRFVLKGMGYDGVIFNDIPKINSEELYILGTTKYHSARGCLYFLKMDELYVDLYSSYGGEINEHITGYEDLEDFLRMQEQTIVVFSNDQIEILEEIPQN